jgi:predicted permease
VAWLLTLAFEGESLVRMPAFEGFSLDMRTAAFVIATVVVAALVFGVAPAVLAGRFDLGAALRATGDRETGRSGALRSALAAGQIGLTLALVTAALLMVRTIANLRSVDTGLDIDNVATLFLSPPGDLGPEEAFGLQRRLLEATEAVPGVERAALDRFGPHGATYRAGVALPGRMPPRADTYNLQEVYSRPIAWEVTPGWFELFGVQLIHGRTFVDDDWRVPSTDAVVLTASLARRVFGRTDVVGQVVDVRLRGEPEARTIVGVVGDYTSLNRPSEPTDAIFLPYGAIQTSQMSVMAKISPSAPEALEQVRRVAESLFPDLPVPEPAFLSERVENLHSEEGLLERLLGILSSFGVLLSTVGLFGVVFFIVNHRQREFGIRRALGADTTGIIALIVRAALLIVAGGTLIGLAMAFGLSRVLESRLFGVGSLDPFAYLGAAGVVLLAAVLACLAPTRVALRSDPVTVLRSE